MSQAYQARFIQVGESIDYTPGSAVAAGQVVVQGSMIGVAKVPIEANRLGALAVKGVFDVVKANEQIALGAALYWDADGNPYGGTPGTGCATTTAVPQPQKGSSTRSPSLLEAWIMRSSRASGFWVG